MTVHLQSRIVRSSWRGCRWTLLALGFWIQQANCQTVIAPVSAGQPSYLPAPPSVKGTPLDRVVAIVNGTVILDSDVSQELRFDSLGLDDKQLGPSKATPELTDRSLVIERLINRELILQQIQLEPPMDIGTDAVDKQIAELRRSIPGCARYDCKTEAGWQAYLSSIHVTDKEFRAHWLQRLQVLAFTERRFSMGIRIPPEQVRTYYEQTLLPQYRLAGAKAPPLESISARIQQVLIEQQVSALLTDWLHSLRAQGSVIVLHPGEEAP